MMHGAKAFAGAKTAAGFVPRPFTDMEDEDVEKPADGAEIAPPDAEKLLGLYHETAAGVKDAVFVLTCITPAKTKGAAGAVSPQKFRIGDVAGMATEAKGRGSLCNVYFGPAVMRKDLPADRGARRRTLLRYSASSLRRTRIRAKR